LTAGNAQYFSNPSTSTQTTINASDGDSFTAQTAATYTKGSFTLYIRNVANIGTWTYTVVSQDTAKSTIFKTATFTLTVTAGNTAPVAANSDAQIGDTTRTGWVALVGDSSIVASAGTVSSSAAAAARIFWVQKNSDSLTTTAGGAIVGESVVATVTSGPGTVAIGTAACTAGQYTVTAGGTDSYIKVCNEPGKSGTTVVTLKTNSMNPWKSFTVIFSSTTVDSFTLATSSTLATSTLSLNGGTIAAPVTQSAALRVTAKDAATNVITSGALIYVYSSDTKVVTNYGACTNSGGSVATGKTYYTCDLSFADSGTVTLTVGDSNTVARSVKTATISVTVSGNTNTATVALDKSSYTPGEKVILTMTAKDSAGRNVADDNESVTGTGFTTLSWVGGAPTFTATSGSDAAGGTFTDLKTFVDGSGYALSYVSGVDTATAYAPTTPGTYTLKGYVGNATAATTLLAFTVVDATKDAADAATDAALEATDAAYAAQDAAQLAAEAADAATAAAEAATAAVEDLATQVASLFADLQKQITTLANVVAKIAKKVKA